MDLIALKVKQKRWSFSTKKYATIIEEVDRLLAAGFIQEAHYLEWLSNVVIVKKASGKWQMYVDFTDLNKACSKDSLPLSCNDLIVDSWLDTHSSALWTCTMGTTRSGCA